MSTLLQSLASASLFFTHDTFIVPFIVLGYIWGNSRTFLRGLSFLLTAMPLNFLLKEFFQVPLHSAVSQTKYAFPSGHMHSSMVFYGFFFSQISSFVQRVWIVLLLTCAAWALVYKGYHTPVDVLGGVCFGAIALVGFLQIPKSGDSAEAGIFLAINTLFIALIATIGPVPPHLIMSYATLLSIICFDRILGAPKPPQSLWIKSVLTILVFVAIAFFYMGSIYILPRAYIELRWLAIGASLPALTYAFSTSSICLKKD